MFGLLALSDGVQIALIVTTGSVIVGGIPILTVIINRAVARGAKDVKDLNTAEHKSNSAKLDVNAVKIDSLVAAMNTQGTTLDRVEASALRQSTILADHLNWHMSLPSAPQFIIQPATTAAPITGEHQTLPVPLPVIITEPKEAA